ncbi:DsbA family protein [Longivirga aurantiaca]|uniref:DsbA family protein n=1 Tax=Longivirga aurantiaca TaxID=1837743 RepID=A0ABW1T0S4_9ACTN
MPAVSLSEVDSPSPRRDDDGAVVLDWWVDLCCPDVLESAELLDELRDELGDRLVVRLRHLPLVSHVWAVAAAQCQVEAAAQGRGEEFAAHAIAQMETLEGPGDYVELAEHLGLDSDEVALALFDGRHAAAVKAEHDEGRALGVTGTPTFVVDGLLVDAGDTLVGAKDAVLTRVRRALA